MGARWKEEVKGTHGHHKDPFSSGIRSRGTRKILCVFSKLEPIITKRLDNYSQLRLLCPGLWCPNPALGRERAVTMWAFGEAMKVEAVPRRKTGNWALHAQ